MNDFLGRHISSYVASWSAAQPCKSSALQTDGRTELSDGQLHPAVEDREQNEHVVIWMKIIIDCDTFECWLENEVAGLRLYRAMIFSTGSWFWSGACAEVSRKRRHEQRKEKHCRRTFFSFLVNTVCLNSWCLFHLDPTKSSHHDYPCKGRQDHGLLL